MLITNQLEKLAPQTLATAFYIVVIVFSFVSFLYNGIFRTLADIHPDFYVNLYAPGQLWLEGENVYDYEIFRERVKELEPEKALMNDAGFLYPPQTAALASIFARFPVQVAHILVVCTNLVLLAICLILFLRLLSNHIPIGLREIAFVCWIVFNTAFARGNIRGGQVGILICVAILVPYVISTRHKNILAGASVAFLSLKPHFVPLFAGYFLVKRAWVALITCIVMAGIMTLAPLILTGRPVIESISGWVESLSEVSRPGRVNDTDPFSPASALLIHLQPLVFRILNTNASPASIIAWVVILGFIAYGVLTLVKRKNQEPRSDLYALALVSGLSLMAVYHRNYDIFLVFPALIYLYINITQRSNTNNNIFWSVFLAATLLAFSLPGDLLLQIAGRFPQLNASYLWRVVAPFQSWFVLATLGAVILIYRQPLRETATNPR